MFVLTGEILRKIGPSISVDRANLISNILTKVCPQYGINSADIFHEFIANVLHESGEFTILSESLNYQSVALKKLFSRSRISMEDLTNYGRTATHKANQPAIANCLYGGTWGKINLGNVLSTDGWTFRGAGPMQITGRGNTTKFTNYYNSLTGSKLTADQMADLLRTDLTVGIHSACWFFAIFKELIDEALHNDFKEIVKKINGGFIGMDKRTAYYELAKKYVV